MMPKREIKCSVCKTPFIPVRALQNVCKWQCGLAKVEQKREKAARRSERLVAALARKDVRQRKEKAKSLTKLLAEAQVPCNKYVRARDGKVCISCGTTKPDIQYCAGHYRTRKAAAHLRFNLDNLNVQCNKRCNLSLSGNIVAYRIGLIKKIGLDRVLALENNNEIHRYTREEAIEIKAKYGRMAKEVGDK